MDIVGPETLSRLIDEHGASLVLYAQQWSDGPEDVVQEAMVRLMRQHPVPENVVGWLYRLGREVEMKTKASRGRAAAMA